MKEIAQLIEAKNYQEAERKLNELLAHDKNNLSAKEWYGYLEMSQKNYIKSKQYLEEVLIAKPQNPTLLYNLGLVYENLGEKDKAIDFFTKCLNIDGNHKKSKEKLDKLNPKKDIYGLLKYEWSPSKSSSNIYYCWAVIYAIIPLIAISSYLYQNNLKNKYDEDLVKWKEKREKIDEKRKNNMQKIQEDGINSDLSPEDRDGVMKDFIEDSKKMSQDFYEDKKTILDYYASKPKESNQVWRIISFFGLFLSIVALPRCLSNFFAGFFLNRTKYQVFEGGIKIYHNGINRKLVQKYMYEIPAIELCSPFPLSFTNDGVVRLQFEPHEIPNPYQSLDHIISPWSGNQYHCLFTNDTYEKMEEIRDYIDNQMALHKSTGFLYR